MGNSLNPTGYRIGVSKDWQSKWFAKKDNYGDLVIEDYKIREYLRNALSNAGLEKILIERSINEVKITLIVARPGFVIGKGGAGVTLLREDLAKYTKDKITLSVEEVEKAEVSATLIAQSIASQIERRIHYKRAVLGAISKAVDNGVSGIRIMTSGVLSGANTIARSEEFKEGSIPKGTIKANIDYGYVPAKTNYGVIGIRIWVYRGE